jgi:hypothetical protein
MGGAFYHHPTFRANHLNWVPSFYQLELGFQSKTQGVIYQSYVYCYFLKALEKKKESLSPTSFYYIISTLFYRTIERQVLRSLSSIGAKHLALDKPSENSRSLRHRLPALAENTFLGGALSKP